MFSRNLYEANGKQIAIAETWRQKFGREPTVNNQRQQTNAQNHGNTMTMEASASEPAIDTQGGGNTITMKMPASEAMINNKHAEKKSIKKIIQEIREKAAETLELLYAKYAKVFNDAVYWHPPIEKIDFDTLEQSVQEKRVHGDKRYNQGAREMTNIAQSTIHGKVRIQ